MTIQRTLGSVLVCCIVLGATVAASAATPASGAAGSQSLIGSGVVQGTVLDPAGAVIANAVVKIENPVTGFNASVKTDSNGFFSVRQVPFNHYHLLVSTPGFSPLGRDVEVRSSVPLNLELTLQIATAQTTVNVEGGAEDMVETTPTSHTDISSDLIAQLPVQAQGSGLSSVVTMATPGVTADSNGMFHPLGEHADTTFSIDNQPVSDQQSRVFSNQVSPETVASLEIITGVPPAEFGDKASLVVRATTKSGLGLTQPTGSVAFTYGSFGTSNVGINVAVGTKRFGDFLSVTGLNTGRFLDTPEFRPLHSKGNSESFFDHLDYQLSNSDILHLNLSAARSWFQVPNTYDQQASVQDQRQELKSFNIAPSYSHQFTPNLLFSANAYVRQDHVTYYPSSDSFYDEPATLAENRRLMNAGIKADLSYVNGAHNIKVGAEFDHTFLNESFRIGITSPTFNAPCTDANGVPVDVAGVMDPSACVSEGFLPNDGFQAGLLPIDLTRGGSPFVFHGHTDIKSERAYVQDSIKVGDWNFTLGLRADNYDGISHGSAVQPRVGVSYTVKKTGTVLRASYGRIFLSPYNENLVLSSSTGLGGLTSGSFGEQPITPARRNQFNVGLEQAFGKRFVVSGEYFWKFTNGDYDFDTLFDTPLTFPIQWKKSKIDGASVRLNFPVWHGFTAYAVMGHSRSRFFGPEVGGIIFNSPVDTGVFRIDHDQAFEQTTHFQYQFKENAPWVGFTWTYASGMAAGAVPDFATALTFTADQQAQMGLYCGSVFATLSAPIRSCSSPNFGATRVRIPAAGTYNADTNPSRIAPRNLIDVAVGFDNIFRGDRYKWDLQLTGSNLTNAVALYNFMSTFSGTHFVTPRTFQAELKIRF